MLPLCGFETETTYRRDRSRTARWPAEVVATSIEVYRYCVSVVTFAGFPFEADSIAISQTATTDRCELVAGCSWYILTV